MRINIHEHTPNDLRKMKITFIILGILLYSIPVLLACLFIVEAKAISAAVITLILPIGFIYFLFRSIFCMAQSYAEFDDEKVVVVECYAFHRKIKSVQRNRIKQRESIFVTKAPGRRPAMSVKVRTFMDALGSIHNGKGFNYIVFKDENGQYLFKILDTPEGNQWAEIVMKNQ